MGTGLRLCLALLIAAAATAAPAASTRLMSCGAQTCLLVTGAREARDARVAINGHVVSVEGGRAWRLRLPLATVRAWSEPYARSMTIATGQGEAREVSLPIGLLGHTTDLAALEVRAH